MESTGGAGTGFNGVLGRNDAVGKLQAGAVMTEGKKDDNDKLRMDLIPPEAIYALASILTMGAVKYDARNWEKGIAYGRVYAATQRHLVAWWSGECLDDESGKSHLWHALTEIVFLATFEARGMTAFDDRPRVQRQPTWDDVVEAAVAVRAVWEPQEWRLP